MFIFIFFNVYIDLASSLIYSFVCCCFFYKFKLCYVIPFISLSTFHIVNLNCVNKLLTSYHIVRLINKF